jgi:hypothetical protein
MEDKMMENGKNSLLRSQPCRREPAVETKSRCWNWSSHLVLIDHDAREQRGFKRCHLKLLDEQVPKFWHLQRHKFVPAKNRSSIFPNTSPNPRLQTDSSSDR